MNPIDIELVTSINEFVETVVTENRLKQGISYFKENNIEIGFKSTGQFLAWVVKDVLKEESDLLEQSNLDEKKIKNAITTKARIWFLNSINL